MDNKFAIFNGSIIEAQELKLHASDLAILRGYAVFDYFRVSNGVPIFLDDYLDRFLRSASSLKLQFQWTREEIRLMIHTLINSNSQQEGAIRLVMTGGYSEGGYSIGIANLLIISYPPMFYPEYYFSKGVRVMTLQHQRELPHIKSINYLTGLYHAEEMEKRNAQFLLYHDGKYFRECDRYNVFFVNTDGVIITPEIKVLHGITRKKILQIAEENGFAVQRREVEISELHTMQEVFITSTTIGTISVLHMDNFQIGNGLAGPVAMRLRTLFYEYCADYENQQKQSLLQV